MFVQDQIGRELKLPSQLDRIISVVPSLTELLFDLGLGPRIIGVTKFCVHPSMARTHAQIIGGTKNLKVDLIKQLNPQLVIANKEENTRADIERLAEFVPVWVSDIATLSDALNTIIEIGDLVGSADQAQRLVQEIKLGFNSIPRFKPRKAVYLIWQKPFMAAGADTFIHDLMHIAGYQNLITANRYPELGLGDLQSLAPEVLLLSSEPFPFKQKHLEQLQRNFPHTEVKLVDGELFSWYGSRLRHSPGYFKQLRKSEAPN